MRRMFTFLFFAISGFAHSQHYFTIGQLNFETDPGQSRYTRIGLSGNVPLWKKNGRSIFISPGAEVISVPFNSANMGGVSLPVTFFKTIGTKWSYRISVIPRMNDLNFDLKNLQMGLAAIVGLKINDSLSFHGGLYYNDEYFGPFVVPLLGMYYRMNNNVSLYGTLPSSLAIEKAFTEVINAGFQFRSVNNSYILPTTFPYTTRESIVRLAEAKLMVFGEYYFAPKLAFRIEAGHTFARRFRHYYYPEDPEYVLGSFLIGFSVSYRVRLPGN